MLSKKLIAQLVTSILFSFLCINASYPQITFQKTFSIGSANTAGKSIFLTNDGGYIIVGDTFSGGTQIPHIFLMKINVMGDIQWTKSYGGTDGDIANSVRQTSDGGYIILGTSWSFSSQNGDIILIRTDSIGNVIWTKTYIGGGPDFGISVYQTNDGGFMVFGNSGPLYHFIKTDTNGNMVWRKYINSIPTFNMDNSFIQTKDGGYAIIGSTNVFGAGNLDVFLVKTDANANVLWAKTYGAFGYEDGYSVQQTADSGYVIVGRTESFGPSQIYDIYLIRTDKNGSLLWSKHYGGPSIQDIGFSVQQTTDGGYIITGQTTAGFSIGPTSIFLMKTDLNGDIVWAKTYGVTGSVRSFLVNLTQDGGYIILGRRTVSNAEIYLIKTDSIGNSGCNQLSGNPSVTNSPTTEGSGSVTIDSALWSDTAAVIINSPVIDDSVLCYSCDSIAAAFGYTDSLLIVNFSDSSLPALPAATTWFWDFGDGDTSTLQNPAHTYTSNGTYNVCLIATNACNSDTFCDSITVGCNFSVLLTSYPVSCLGGSNGAVDLTVTGSTAPYKYDWSTGDTTEDITGKPQGNYSVNITDSMGCVSIDSIVISGPPALIASIAATNVTCEGGSDGAADLTVSGGMAPYTYNWFNGDTTEDISGLLPGIYIITVTDSCGDVVIDSTTITEPTVLSSTISGINVTCNGGSDGAIYLIVSGGTPPYSYSWSNGDTIEDISGLLPGNYLVTVTDSCGDVVIDSTTITEPPPLSSTISGTNITCNGGNDGAADLTISGGTAPYAYSWSNGDTTEDIIGLYADTYIVTIIDSCGNVFSDTVIVSEPTALNSSIIHTDVSCNGGNDGTVDITVSGGVPPYTYSWSVGDTTEDISGLSAGIYIVSINDNNDCVIINSDTISEPTALNIFTSYLNASSVSMCDGVASVAAFGGTPPYDYIWSDPLAQTSQIAIGLCVGSYTITVTDTNGCIGVDTIMIDIASGISELNNIRKINIYPNPNTGEFIIEILILNEVKELQIKLFNIFGQVIYEEKQKLITEHYYKRMNLKNYTKGVYILQVLTNNEVVNKKIVFE